MKDNYNQTIKEGDYIYFNTHNNSLIGQIKRCYRSGKETQKDAIEIKYQNNKITQRFTEEVIKMDKKQAKKLLIEKMMKAL